MNKAGLANQTGSNEEVARASPLKVRAVRYIKLGPGRKWAAEALKRGIVPLDFRGVGHDACARGDWDEVRRQLIAMGRKERALKDDERELKDFYRLGPETLWFTIANGYVWWTFAQDGVLEGDQDDADAPPRFRPVRTAWRNTGLTGRLLTERSFSSALSSIASYRRTICEVREAGYLLRRIRGEDEPLRLKANQLFAELTTTAADLVRRLDWRDFETLVDLIFAHSGYRRQTALGGAQPDVDFIARQPLTGDTAWVQVKSHATQAVFEDYLERFEREAGAGAFFFIYHSANRPIRMGATMANVHIWSADKIASAAVEAGLFGWVAERVL
ncbi:restriction endonuclease [Bradyrhizobium sp. NC92]|uniref:restriction endonuclease n=1 Tax=Bradyrhizobium sp. (strain NC92) TaxID=55395 RepID=UPI0021AAB4E3|nr:restriction endonuclease [Bradyrhizobium sp. NC92]UWU67595.1 restriction endonuclease [Bradyrhizobium sp. NC92]